MAISTQEEPILKENKDRFVLFPIRQHDIWKYYKQAEASFKYFSRQKYYLFLQGMSTQNQMLAL